MRQARKPQAVGGREGSSSIFRKLICNNNIRFTCILWFRNSTSVWTAAAAAKSLQSCPTLCDPTDGSPPGSPIPGILQARTLEWVALSFSVWTSPSAFKILEPSWGSKLKEWLYYDILYAIEWYNVIKIIFRKIILIVWGNIGNARCIKQDTV